MPTTVEALDQLFRGASPFVGTPIAREPRQHVHSVRVRFLPQLRDKRDRDALREQRLERGELGAFPLATHRGSLPQLIADGHVHPSRRTIRRDDSANHRRLGQHRVLRPSNELCREERGDVLTWNDRSAAARTQDRRPLAQKLNEPAWANRARGELGLVALLLGDTNAAIVNLGQAIKVAEANGDTSSLVRWLTLFGHGHVELGRPEQAFDFYERALKIARTLPELQLAFMTLVGKADVLIKIGRVSEAEEHNRDARGATKECEFLNSAKTGKSNASMKRRGRSVAHSRFLLRSLFSPTIRQPKGTKIRTRKCFRKKRARQDSNLRPSA